MNNRYIDGYLSVTKNILEHPLVVSMDTFNHHAGISTHFHSVFVSYMVYSHCAKRGFDEKLTKEITQAALLHDFYLYDWPTQKHEENHIFYHPKESVKNINKTKIIKMNDMQRDMILNHMFPLAHVPNSKGGWMLTMADKYCATRELVEKKKCFEKTYNEIMGEINNA